MDRKKVLLWVIALFLGLQITGCVWYGHDYDDYGGYYGHPYDHERLYRYRK